MWKHPVKMILLFDSRFQLTRSFAKKNKKQTKKTRREEVNIIKLASLCYRSILIFLLGLSQPWFTLIMPVHRLGYALKGLIELKCEAIHVCCGRLIKRLSHNFQILIQYMHVHVVNHFTPFSVPKMYIAICTRRKCLNVYRETNKRHSRVDIYGVKTLIHCRQPHSELNF